MKPTDYIRSDRRGREAHDLESEALRDPFLGEALEGLETAPQDAAAAVERLQRRLAERAAQLARQRRLGRIRRIAAAAAAVAIMLTAGLLTWRHAPTPGLPGGETAESLPFAGDSLAGDSARLARTAPHPPMHKPEAPAAGSGSDATDAELELAFAEETAGPESDRHTPAAGPSPNAPTAPHAPAASGAPAAPAAPAASGASDAESDGNAAAGEMRFDQEIEEVVVVAYGVRKKSAFAGSVEAPTGSAPSHPGTGHAAADRQSAESPAPAADSDTTGEDARENTARTDDGPADGDTLILTADRDTDRDAVFLVAETMPRFQGGDLTGFRRWVQARIVRPETVPEAGGRVIVTFLIDTLGRLTEVKVIRSPDRKLAREAVRVLRLSPLWEPGRQGFRKVPVRFTMPVDFDPLPPAPAPRPVRRSGTVSPADTVEMGGVPVSFEDFERMTEPTIVVIGTPDAPDTLQADFRTGRVEGITQPRFQEGGFDAFRTWADARLRKPDPALVDPIPTAVVVAFTVDTLGRTTDIRVLQTPDRTLSDDAVHAVESSPRWTPGERNGKKVAVRYWLRIDYRTRTAPAPPGQ